MHLRKIPANITEGRLLGGIDLSATLQHGKPISETGLLGECDKQVVIAAMAERLPRNTVHYLCAALDDGLIAIARDGIETKTAARITLIATDEGTEDEWAHAALTDRLGLSLDMTTLGIHDVDDECFKRSDVERALANLGSVIMSDEHLSALASLALSLGIDSPRSTLAAVKVARAAAALKQKQAVEEEEVALALRLCLLPRAQQIPEMAEPPPEPEREPEQTDDNHRPKRSVYSKRRWHSYRRACWKSCRLKQHVCDKAALAPLAPNIDTKTAAGRRVLFAAITDEGAASTF
jgi:magnesium chelatase subunit D